MAQAQKFEDRFNFTGYRTTFPVGCHKDIITFILTHDDGTRANYIIVEFNNVPYATIPITDKEGLQKMITVLQELHDEGF